MEDYTWQTDEPHFDNTVTMGNFIDCVLPDVFPLSTVELQDGTYAEITMIGFGRLGVHASGDGDSNNHRVSFERI